MEKNCNNCIFYNSASGYKIQEKFGTCDKIEFRTHEEFGFILNPDRVYDRENSKWREGDYIKPSYVPDEASKVNVNFIFDYPGGDTAELYVGENFGCIHFKDK